MNDIQNQFKVIRTYVELADSGICMVDVAFEEIFEGYGGTTTTSCMLGRQDYKRMFKRFKETARHIGTEKRHCSTLHPTVNRYSEFNIMDRSLWFGVPHLRKFSNNLYSLRVIENRPGSKFAYVFKAHTLISRQLNKLPSIFSSVGANQFVFFEDRRPIIDDIGVTVYDATDEGIMLCRLQHS